MAKLQTLLKNDKTAKVDQEKKFQARLDKFRDYPQLDQFKIKALETNKLLSRKLNELCQKMAQVEPLCKITSSLIDESISPRLEFDDTDDKISKFLSWKDS